MKNLTLKSFRLKNFKAIRDSGTVELAPLTVLIGNNGSGKSSFIEGLETYQTVVQQGLEVAFNRWRGFEYAHNRLIPRRYARHPQPLHQLVVASDPIEFELSRKIQNTDFRITLSVTLDKQDKLFIQKEQLCFGKNKPVILQRHDNHSITFAGVEEKDFTTAGISILSETLRGAWTRLPKQLPDTEETHRSKKWLEHLHSNNSFWESFNWQFITLNHEAMGWPRPPKRTGGEIRLHKDGSNVAEYLLSIRHLSQSTFEGILEALQYVLPYAQDLQPVLTSELERAIYLQLTESQNTIPGWLLSTGTLRLVALLALLRHPKPPPLMVIEEIENGLDPRTIHLLVEEIHNVVERGKTQMIVTTHSPYFLDLLSLSHLVLVERDEDNEPRFIRPGHRKELVEWSKKFAPGQLYTMGKLHH